MAISKYFKRWQDSPEYNIPVYSGLDPYTEENPSYLGIVDRTPFAYTPSQITDAQTPGSAVTDPAQARALSSVMNTGMNAATTSAGAMLGQGAIGALTGTLTPERMTSAAMTGFNPMSLATTGIGGLLSSTMGLDPSSKTSKAVNYGSALLGLMTGNPAIGVFGGILAPTIAEGIGKLTESRTDEGRKRMIDNFSSGFLDTAKISRDISDYANMTPAYADTFNREDGTPVSLGLSPSELAKNAMIDSSRRVVNTEADLAAQRSALEAGSRVPTSLPSLTTPVNNFAGFFADDSIPDYSSSLPTADSAAIRNVNALENLRDNFKEQGAFAWNQNPNSVRNPSGFNAMAARMGLDLSGYSPEAIDAAVRDFNNMTAGNYMNLGDISSAVRNLRNQEAWDATQSTLAAAQAAVGRGATAAQINAAFDAIANASGTPGSVPGLSDNGRLAAALGAIQSGGWGGFGGGTGGNGQGFGGFGGLGGYGGGMSSVGPTGGGMSSMGGGFGGGFGGGDGGW